MLHDGPESRVFDVLLVEDNPADVRLVREAIKGCVYKCRLNVVTDGLQAVQYLRNEGGFTQVPRPDLILLDLNLPIKDGREVLHDIKEDDNLKDIPVVILTTSRSKDDVVGTYRLHANCFLTKPTLISDFFELVCTLEKFWFELVMLPSMSESG